MVFLKRRTGHKCSENIIVYFSINPALQFQTYIFEQYRLAIPSSDASLNTLIHRMCVHLEWISYWYDWFRFYTYWRQSLKLQIERFSLAEWPEYLFVNSYSLRCLEISWLVSVCLWMLCALYLPRYESHPVRPFHTRAIWIHLYLLISSIHSFFIFFMNSIYFPTSEDKLNWH